MGRSGGNCGRRSGRRESEHSCDENGNESLLHGPPQYRVTGFRESPPPIRKRVNALGPAPRAELLHVLMLPEFDRADRIGEFWSYPESRTFAELLIDCEEDRALRAMLVGMLREADRS
jgi:hypothetical protein